MSRQESLPARVLPNKLADRLRFERARRAWRAANVVFVHIPKNAGVSISRAIYGRPLGHYSTSDIIRRDPVLLQRVYSFAVLRDPVERALSAYRFARAGSTAEMGVADPHRYQIPEFGDFDSFVRAWLAEQDLAEVDGIFRTQTSYVVCDGGVAVQDLFCLSDLRPVTSMLRSRVRENLVLEHRNATDKHLGISVAADSVELIRHLYRQDYDLIGALTQ